MAYFQDKKRQNTFGGPTNTVGGLAGGIQTIQNGIGPKASGAPTQSGGFVNLDTYLNLNKAPGQAMANQLNQSVSQGLADANKKAAALTPAYIKANSVHRDSAGNVISGGAGYNSAADMPEYGAIQGDISKASEKAKQLGGGFDQRQSLVNETFSKGAGDYTQGMGLYDNALASAYGGKQFEQTGKAGEASAKNLESIVGNTANMAPAFQAATSAAYEAERKRREQQEAQAAATAEAQAAAQNEANLQHLMAQSSHEAEVKANPALALEEWLTPKRKRQEQQEVVSRR